MFIEPALQYFAKTGSIGRTFTMCEAIAVISPTSKAVLAEVGYCSVGWRLPSNIVETCGGLIGVEIARMLNLAVQLNSDYTPEGAAMLLTDPDYV